MEICPEADVRITNIALTDELADASGRTTVKLNYTAPEPSDESDEEDEDAEPSQRLVTTAITSLTPGKVSLFFLSSQSYSPSLGY